MVGRLTGDVLQTIFAWICRDLKDVRVQKGKMDHGWKAYPAFASNQIRLDLSCPKRVRVQNAEIEHGWRVYPTFASNQICLDFPRPKESEIKM
jgi:hypothetical protein